MTGLEWAAVGIVAVLAVAGLVWLGVRALIRGARSGASAAQRESDLRSQADARARADEIGAQPPPTYDEQDAWDRGED